MEVKRWELMPHVYLTYLPARKFKTGVLSAQFITPLAKETASYNALLPALETPTHTEGYEGFFHLQELHGKAEKATMEYIVRDHDMQRFQERKAMMDKAAEQINRRWGDGTAVVDTQDQYYNMYEVLKDHMEIIALAEAAMKAAGIENPTHSPIRGGTDGSVLTYKGLLCPNLPSAGHNAHGRYEYAPVESLKTGVKIVKSLVAPQLVERVIGKKESGELGIRSESTGCWPPWSGWAWSRCWCPTRTASGI